MAQHSNYKMHNEMARRMAESEDPKRDALKIQQEVLQDNVLIVTAVGYLAIQEIFDAVCAGLQLTPGARSYLEDNYDADELGTAFSIMFGLIQRPFGGTRKGIAPTRPTMTG
jgi:hypothetical protein